MSLPEAEPVVVQIMGKEYHVACPEKERQALLESAGLLDRRMRQIRDTGRVVGGDRIAVMAALNITHELLNIKRQQDGLDDRLQRLRERLDSVLESVGERTVQSA